MLGSTERTRWRRTPAAIGVVCLISLVLLYAVQSAPLDAAPRKAGARVIFEKDSAYHRVRVVQRSPTVRDLFIDASLQSSARVNDPLSSLPYEHFKHFAKLVRPGIKDILAIGLGGGTSSRQFIATYPDVEIDAVEIDPVIIGVAQEYFGVKPGDRLRLHAADGRAFLRRSSRRYDLITVDTYTRGRYGSTIPQHLVTREFFLEASARLNDGGILHFHCYVSRDARFSRALYKTLAAVFPSVVVLGETEFFASNAPLHVDVGDLQQRAGYLRTFIPDIDNNLATLRTTAPQTDDVPLLTDDFAPVDSLLRGFRAPAN